MAKRIFFSVHRNPLPDSEGNTTYQVRNENFSTIETRELLEHLQFHGLVRRELMEMALIVLQKEIVEQVTDNKRLHLNGIGTFFLKIGLRKHLDEDGNEYQPVYTDPDKITGNDVAVESICFTPDSELLQELNNSGYYFENVNPKGTVGKSAEVDLDQLKPRLKAYLDEHGFISAHGFRRYFGLTRYMGDKLLLQLINEPSPLIKRIKEGNAYIYRLR